MKIFNKISRTISMLLLVAILLSIGQPTVLAVSNSNNATITLDTNNQRIAECIEGKYKYISVYDKKSKIAKISKISLDSGKMIDVNSYDLNKKTSLEDNKSIENYSQRARSIKQNTFSNYEYTKWYGNPNKWELRKPKEGFGLNKTCPFQTYETSKNKDYINKFYDAVEDINRLEKDYISAVGTEVLTATLGAIYTGGLSALLTSIGATSAAIAIANHLAAKCRIAEDNYWETYYKSSIL